MITPKTRQTRTEVAGHYDELDHVYREVWGEHVHHGFWLRGDESIAQATDALTDLVASHLAITPGSALIDIGCGYGKSAERIASHYDVSVTGLTVSAEQAAIGAARSPARGAVDIRLGDWMDNGLAAGAFDGAYAIESTEHMIDKQRIFDEAFRVLTPGSRMVVCAWVASDAPTRWQVDHLLEPICREGALPGMGTRADYDGWAQRAGFSVTSHTDISTQVARTWGICIRRLAVKLLTRWDYLRMLISPRTQNRAFLWSMFRLVWAYHIRAMRYDVLVYTKG